MCVCVVSEGNTSTATIIGIDTGTYNLSVTVRNHLQQGVTKYLPDLIIIEPEVDHYKVIEYRGLNKHHNGVYSAALTETSTGEFITENITIEVEM